MKDLHVLMSEEATIKIIPSYSSLLSRCPEWLKEPYWVSLGEGGDYRISFKTLQQAVDYIAMESLHGNS